MKKEIINLIEGFKQFCLASVSETPLSETPLNDPETKGVEEPQDNEVSLKTFEEYILVDGETTIKVYEDGTIEGIEVEPNKEYVLVGDKVLVTDDEGKFAEIKDLVVPEEEKPIEVPVDFESQLKDRDELIETLMSEIETLKEKITNFESEKTQLNEEIVSLKSQIPTVVAGVEVKKEEEKEQEVKLSTEELLKQNFGFC